MTLRAYIFCLCLGLIALNCQKGEPEKKSRESDSHAVDSSGQGKASPKNGATQGADTSAGRTIPFDGGVVTVTTEKDVDRVIIVDTTGDTLSMSWCPREAGTYDEFSAFFGKLRTAFLAGDKNAVTDLLNLPLRVNRNGTSWIETKENFQRNYDKLFTKAVLEQIRTADPRLLFCADDGAMMGSGVLWAKKGKDGKIGLYAVNP